MNTAPLNLLKFRDKSANERHQALGLLFTFPIDLLLLVARYLDYDDFEALALTSQLAYRKFREYLTYDKFRENVRPARRLLMEDFRCDPIPVNIKTPRSRKVWNTENSMMTGNGKWLYILRRRSDHLAVYCLDVFEQQSLTPLEYRHVHREQFSTQSPTIGYYSMTLVGTDPREDNPGVYLSDVVGEHWWGNGPAEITFRTTRQLYSWHLHGAAPRTLRNLGDRLPYPNIAVKCGADRLEVYGVEENTRLTKRVLTYEGEILAQDDNELDLDEGVYRLRFSPNAKMLLLTERNQGKLTLVKDMEICQVIPVSRPLTTTYDVNPFSVTDDGGAVIARAKIFPCNGFTIHIPIDFPFESGLFAYMSAHSGDASLILDIGVHDGYAQKFAKRKLLPWRAEAMLIQLFAYMEDHQGSYFQMMNHLLQCAEQFHSFNAIRNAVNLRNPRIIYIILHELYARNSGINLVKWEKFLLFLSDVITMQEIIELARAANLLSQPRTGVVELALSERGQALKNVFWGTAASEAILKSWFKEPLVIPTNEIGTICSATFLWGPHASDSQNIRSDLFDQYTRYRDFSPKNKEIVSFRGGIAGKNPLVTLCQELRNGETLIEIFCKSNNPKTDRTRHKLIPSGVATVLQTTPPLGNYLLLNTLLKKMIKATKSPDQKHQLNTIRLAMMNAVDSNPSLRYDMTQLLQTHFYGNDSLQDALEKTPYFKEFLKYFGESMNRDQDYRRGLHC